MNLRVCLTSDDAGATKEVDGEEPSDEAASSTPATEGWLYCFPCRSFDLTSLSERKRTPDWVYVCFVSTPLYGALLSVLSLH